MGENEKKQIFSQFMCTIKSNWHKPNPWGGYFCSAYKKKWSWYYKLRFTPARFMTLLIIILRFPLLLCCFLPFTTITLGERQRKGCKGGVHILGGMTFLCQQEQNQLQTTQCWFAGKQREKTAESFLTSSCSSSGTSLPRGFCCQREERAWQPPMRSRQGLRDSIISPRD